MLTMLMHVQGADHNKTSSLIFVLAGLVLLTISEPITFDL